MQLPEVLHFKLLIQFLFDLQKFVLIVAHQNEVIHIDHNEKLHISHLCNVHTRIDLTLHKFNAFSETHLTLDSMPLEIVSNHTRTCEVYTQDVHLLRAQTLEVAPCKSPFQACL